MRYSLFQELVLHACCFKNTELNRPALQARLRSGLWDIGLGLLGLVRILEGILVLSFILLWWAGLVRVGQKF